MSPSRLIEMKNTKVRLHGFEWPPSCMQVVSWVGAILLVVAYALAVASIVQDADTFSLVALGLLSFVYLVAVVCMVIYTYRVTASDPSDPTVALERSHHLQPNLVEFNQLDYSYFCDICNTHVLPDTKHCSVCNRCSYSFDHHCVWVGNDIGGENYVDFIRMLTSVFVMLLVQILTLTLQLVIIEAKEQPQSEMKTL